MVLLIHRDHYRKLRIPKLTAETDLVVTIIHDRLVDEVKAIKNGLVGTQLFELAHVGWCLDDYELEEGVLEVQAHFVSAVLC